MNPLSVAHGVQSVNDRGESGGNLAVTGESTKEAGKRTEDAAVATAAKNALEAIEERGESSRELAVAHESGREVAEQTLDGGGEVAVALEAGHQRGGAFGEGLALQSGFEGGDAGAELGVFEGRHEA